MSDPDPIDLKWDKSGWTPTRLGELASDVNDRVANPAESNHDRFVGLEHFVSGDLKIKAWQTTEGLVSAAKAFKSGDILFARRNAYLKRASMVGFDGVCSGDAFVIREDHEKLIPGFLAFVMNSKSLWRHAISNAAGTMSKRVKWRDLANYEFLLPPKDQQAKLAKLLLAADASLTKNSGAADTLHTFFKSFRASFLGNLKESAHEIVQVADIGSTDRQPVQVGPFGGSVSSRHFVPTGVPIIKIYNLTDNDSLDLSKLVYVSEEHAASLARYKIRSGDILIAVQGATTGRSALADDRVADALISQHLIRVAFDTSKCIPEFAREVFSSNLIKQQVDTVKAKTTREGLNTDDVASFRMPLPQVRQQQQFVEQINRMREGLARLNVNRVSTSNLLKSLINQIF